MNKSGPAWKIFKTDLEPQRSTIAQRQGTYSADLMVAVKIDIMKSAPENLLFEPAQKEEVVDYCRRNATLTYHNPKKKDVISDD